MLYPNKLLEGIMKSITVQKGRGDSHYEDTIKSKKISI